MEEPFSLNRRLTKDIIRLQNSFQSQEELETFFDGKIPLAYRLFHPPSLLWGLTGFVYLPSEWGYWHNRPLSGFQESFGDDVIRASEYVSRLAMQNDLDSIELSRGGLLVPDFSQGISEYLGIDLCEPKRLKKIHEGVYNDLRSWIKRGNGKNRNGLGDFDYETDGSIFLQAISHEEYSAYLRLRHVPLLEDLEEGFQN